MPATDDLTTWIEISAAAYANNLHFVRRLVGPEVEIAAVVKANAYGHGWQIIAPLAAAHGAGSFCVHSLEEALQLRQAGFEQDILLLGQVMRRRLPEVVRLGLTLALFDRGTADALVATCRQLRRPAKVHLKIETGTHRQGVCDEELPALVKALKDEPDIEIEGAYTHYANIEDTTRHDFAELQQRRFRDALTQMAELGVRPHKLHTACSAATLLFADTHYQMVRLGISQYGFWSSRETQVSYRLQRGEEHTETLRPVLTWKTRVGQVKSIPADSFIGYGCTYQVTRPTRLAILPVGYSDGYDRHLSNQGHVLIHGRRAPIRGRICMNLTMVDITDIPAVAPEDEVVLIGRQGQQEIRAEDLAQHIGTIQYEVVSRLRAEIPRFVVP